ncbi:GNAT family N-acetyltransferase [Chamaesiphon sp. OTE_20_metabat_361]|uniref:GNAT family N-acetyltransferase n=1 Tax=Chamaesiphon sp. OTE_20_metabat_361 TaxID=2964689 RepID=UPI00286AB5C0|nr:GNAT family N-acetyltransferase [Chamaesiphon sp. OTE_20_metabat_361]
MLSIELLDSKKHDSPEERLRQRTTFKCGVDSLDDYIKTRASQELKKRVSTPYVLTDLPERQVLGYYCLSSYSIASIELDESTAKKLPRYPLLPAILLGRLAVDSRYQGKGYGGFLLLDAMKRCLELSTQLAAVAMVVEAIGQGAVSFYKDYGFIEFPDDPMKLYISIVECEKLGL